MELEELKDLWQKNKSEIQPKNEAEIASMLKGKSKSIIDKLKRSAWFELLLTLISSIALLLYALGLPSGSAKWTPISILILFVGYSIYYVKKLLLLNSFNRGNDNLKASLEHLTFSLTNYLVFYKRSYTILYPVYFCLGLFFAAIESGSQHFFEVLTRPKAIISLIGLAGLLFFICTWFTNWYLKSLYGNHLQKLKNVLQELNSN